MKAIAEMMARAPTREPTTIPAMAPFDNLFDDDCGGADEGPAELAAEEGRVEVELGVGASKPLLVTLKHGGCSVSLSASTNVCCC